MNHYVEKNWLAARAKSIEKQNLKKCGKSQSWVSMLHELYKCTVCMDDIGIEIDPKKYKEIRARLLK